MSLGNGNFSAFIIYGSTFVCGLLLMETSLCGTWLYSKIMLSGCWKYKLFLSFLWKYITCVIRTNSYFFKVIIIEGPFSPQTGAETRGQGVGGSDEVSAGSEGLVGKLLFLAHLALHFHLLQVPWWVWEVLTANSATRWSGFLLWS